MLSPTYILSHQQVTTYRQTVILLDLLAFKVNMPCDLKKCVTMDGNSCKGFDFLSLFLFHSVLFLFSPKCPFQKKNTVKPPSLSLWDNQEVPLL